MPGLSANFREVKRIALLRDPLVSEGSIYFAPPDRLARQTRSPAASTLLLIGDRVSYRFWGERGAFDIDSHPMIRGMADVFRFLLAGDGDALRAIFEMRAISGDGDQWEILLRPQRVPLLERIAEIRVRGNRGTLSNLEIAERNGDTTSTSFSAVNSQRHFSASEAAQLFRLPDS